MFIGSEEVWQLEDPTKNVEHGLKPNMNKGFLTKVSAFTGVKHGVERKKKTGNVGDLKCSFMETQTEN